MKKETIIIQIFERGDVILTPGGLAQVVEDEILDDYVNAGSYYKSVKVRWLTKTSEHCLGSLSHVEKGSCMFDWDTKEEDVKSVKKHLK